MKMKMGGVVLLNVSVMNRGVSGEVLKVVGGAVAKSCTAVLVR